MVPSRILHVYSGNLFGGIETILLTLARYQSLVPETRHEFALCFEGRLSRELEAAGAIVHLLGEVRTRRPWTIWRARARLGRVLASGAFDAVVCHTPWVQAILGSVARAARTRLVFYLHNPVGGTLDFHELWAKRTPPDRVIAVSADTARTARWLYSGVRSDQLYCPMPWDLSRYNRSRREELRRELGCPEGGVVLLQASRLDAWKGHEWLLRALALLRDDPRWVCWIAGGAQRPQEEAYLARLQASAAERGLQRRVRFLGHRSDVPDLLGAADVYCQANTGPEGFSLAFLEACSAGLPLVTTRIGGGAEMVVDAVSGFLVPPRDPGALAEALRRLIDDPSLRERLGAAGRARAVELCDPKRQMLRLAELCVGK